MTDSSEKKKILDQPTTVIQRWARLKRVKHLQQLIRPLSRCHGAGKMGQVWAG